MAKIKGGLLSFNPRGSIGDVITFQGRRSYFHVHKKAKPADPKSASQLADRDIFADVVSTWHLLTAAEKKVYNDAYLRYNNIPGFNIFIKLNKGKTIFWIRFSLAKFGATKKFGGPVSYQIL